MESADGNLRYETADKRHYEDIVRFLLDHFRKIEPLGAAVDLSEREAMSFFPGIIHKSIDSGLSTIVYDRNDEMVAVCLTSIAQRPVAYSTSTWNRPPEESQQDESNNENKNLICADDGATKICALLEYLEEDLWWLLPSEVDRLVKWEIVSVRGDQKRKGIANRLIDLNLDRFRNLRCQGIAAGATAFNSQQLFQKKGYRVLKTVMHEQWRDKNGTPVFKCPDGTDKALLVYKDL